MTGTPYGYSNLGITLRIRTIAGQQPTRRWEAELPWFTRREAQSLAERHLIRRRRRAQMIESQRPLCGAAFGNRGKQEQSSAGGINCSRSASVR